MSQNQIITFRPAGFTLATSDATKAGVVTMSAKKYSRKEYAEAFKADPKANDFDAKYRDYLKGLGVAKAMVVEAMEQAGVPVSSMAIRRDKDGLVIGGRIAWSAVKEKKTSANQLKMLELEQQNKALLERLTALESASKNTPKSEPPVAAKK